MSPAYRAYALLTFMLAFFCSNDLHARNLMKKISGVLQGDVAPMVQEALETMPHLDKIPENASVNVILQINRSDQQNNVGVNPTQFDDYKKMFESGKTKFKSGIDSIIDFISNNKKITLLGAVAGTYVALQATLSYLNYQLSKETCWSLWRGKKSKNFVENKEDKKNGFGKRLLNDIQQAYTTSNDPTDFVSPLTNFMKDTDQERNRLKLYQRLIKVLSILHLKRFFFYDQKMEKNIPERLGNLVSYRKTFLSWLGTVKVNQTKGVSNQDFQLRALRSTTRSEYKKRALSYLQQPSA